MPYSNINELPASIRRVLPKSGQRMFLEVFNRTYKNTKDENASLEVAWGVIKKNFRKKDDMWIANSIDFEPARRYVFEAPVMKNNLIINSVGDEIVIDAILADTTPRKGDGKWFTLEALEAIANQINTSGSTLPDVEHAVMAALEKQFIPQDRIEGEVIKRKGMFNKIQAAVKDGKLWIKAWLDKAYEKIIELYKFLSIEALAKSDEDGGLHDPRYLGFTFTDNPRLPDAQIAGL